MKKQVNTTFTIWKEEEIFTENKNKLYYIIL